LLQVVFNGRRASGKLDLEAVEMRVRTSMHRAGVAALERLLSMPSPEPEHVTCSCGRAAKHHDRRAKQIMTALGRVGFERSYYLCPHCHQGRSPRDRELDVEGVAFSPGVAAKGRRFAARRTPSRSPDSDFTPNRKELLPSLQRLRFSGSSCIGNESRFQDPLSIGKCSTSGTGRGKRLA
jgi:hypothetical protein